MRLMTGVTCCLFLCTVLLVLPVITTAQSDQDIIQRIEELEQWIRDNPGVFDWNVHNELRHLYSIKNPPDLRKSIEHSNIILQYSVMDEYILNILSGWQIGQDTSAVRANLLMSAESYPDLRFIAAACFLEIGDLYTEEGNLEEATSFYLKVAEDNSPDMAQYRILAEERLSQQAQPPAVPSNISGIPEGKADNLIVYVHGCCTNEEFDKDVTKIRNRFWEAYKGQAFVQSGKWEIVVRDWSAHTGIVNLMAHHWIS